MRHPLRVGWTSALPLEGCGWGPCLKAVPQRPGHRPAGYGGVLALMSVVLSVEEPNKHGELKLDA